MRQLWEYLVLEQSTHRTWIADDYGAEGWELVGVARATALVDRLWFKRPLTQKRARQKQARRSPRARAPGHGAKDPR